MNGRLDGKCAIVTGAGSGLGREICALFAAEGGRVIGTDVNAKGLEDTASAIGSSAFTALHHDVTKPEDWQRVIDKAFESGPATILVNNAGVADLRPFSKMDLDGFKRTSAVNLLGPFAGMKLFIEKLRQSASDGPAHGSIVNLASVAAKRLLPGFCAYSASKAALVNLSKALAVEMGRKGDFIRVNAVAPGPVRTPMTESASTIPWEERDHSHLNLIPLKRYGELHEVAAAALYLATDASKFMTGYSIPVDGGWSDL